MKKSLSIQANFIFSFVAQVFIYITPILLSPYLARVLMPTGIGINSVSLSIVSFFSLVILFGFQSYGVKRISQHRDDVLEYSKDFFAIIKVKFILFLTSLIIFLIVCFLCFFKRVEFSVCLLIYGLLLIANFFDISFLFQGLENFRIVTIIDLITRIVFTALIFIFVKEEKDINIYVSLYCGQHIAVSIIGWLFAFRIIKRVKTSFNDLKSVFFESSIYFVPTIVISIATLIDKTMLGFLSSNSEVGFYEEATKITTLIVALLNSLSPVLLSRLSNLFFNKDEDEIKRKLFQTFNLLFLLIFPSIFGVAIINRDLILVFFGSEYIPSINILFILLPTIFTVPFYTILGSSFYIPSGQMHKITKFYIVGELLNLIINIPLIIFLKANGAAIATSVSSLFIFLLFIFYSKKDINYRNVFKKAVKPIISSFLMCIGILCINIVLDYLNIKQLFKIIIDVIFGGIIYLVLLIILKEGLAIFILNKIVSKVFRRNDVL